MKHFDHEHLDVYQVAVDFVVEATRLANGFPRGHSSHADQLRRAAASICCNIAEGSGEFSTAEKARFYRMAKRSATECAALLDVRKALDLAAGEQQMGPDDSLADARRLLVRIVSMLVKMARRAELATDREHGAGTGTGTGTHGHGPTPPGGSRLAGP